MSYQVLARKWRPQTFAQMVGQEHVTTTLANALASGRVAHAYLFTGPRGCGKTTMARLLAKALNCDEGPTAQPCGRCASCQAVAGGTMLDVLEIDAASNTGVDNVRELRESAQYQPTQGKQRVFIIDEVHMLSKGAFNALLKILEEPPPHCYFVFATTEPVRIPRTILSRCQRFDFRLFRLDELVGRLAEICAAEPHAVTKPALELLASLAEGSMRDALSLLDQAVSSVPGELTEASVIALYGLVGQDRYLVLNDALLSHDARRALDLVDELSDAGHDLVEFARGLVGNFRDLLLLRLDPALSARIEKPEAARTALAAQAARFALADLVHLTQRAADNYARLERAPQPRWLLEAQMVEYAQLESQVLLSEILGRLEGLSAGADAAAAPAASRSGVTSTGRASSRGDAAGSGGSQRATAAPRPAAARLLATGGDASILPTAADSARTDAELDAPPAAPDLLSAERAELEGAFTRMVTELHARKPAIGSCLMAAAPRLRGDRLQLVFAPRNAFQRDQVADPKVLALLSELASGCWSRAIAVEAITELPQGHEQQLRDEVQQRVSPTRKQELERRTAENPELGRLLESLGGEMLEES